MVHASYCVPDCEHIGDIRRAENMLRDMGCSVLTSQWDGKDCGEAYVKFMFPENKFETIYNRLSGSSVYYDKDINDFVKRGRLFSKFEPMSRQNFYAAKDMLKNNVSDGFEKEIPLLLFFDEKKSNFDYEQFFNEIVSILGDVNLYGYMTEIVDGCRYHNFLLTTDINNLTNDKMSKIGNHCISNKNGLFTKYHIYGELNVCHKIMGIHYDRFFDNVKKFLNKEPLTYYNYYVGKIQVGSDVYCQDGNFVKNVVCNGKMYELVD